MQSSTLQPQPECAEKIGYKKPALQNWGGNNVLLFNELQTNCNSFGKGFSMQNAEIIAYQLPLSLQRYIKYKYRATFCIKNLTKTAHFAGIGRDFSSTFSYTSSYLNRQSQRILPD